MLDNLKNAKTLIESIYALEALSYYYDITPDVFWNSRYKEILLYCEIRTIRKMEDFKNSIILQEAVTNKLIQADSMKEKPKVIPLKVMFKELFKKK